METASTRNVPKLRKSSRRHPQMAVAIQGRRGEADEVPLGMVASVPQAPHPPTTCAENDDSVVEQCPRQEILDQHDDDEEDEKPGH